VSSLRRAWMSKMQRNSKWIILAVLLVAIGTPNAQADSYTPTFTCTGTCVSLPTAPGVTFPSPTSMQVSWDGLQFDIPFLSPSAPADSYEWLGTFEVANPCPIEDCTVFVINDETTGQTFFDVASQLFLLPGLEGGTLSFARVATPEPPSPVLVLPGIGLLWVMRKRIALALGAMPNEVRK
jgi:hypothetical protein